MAVLAFSSCLNPNKITYNGIEAVRLRGVTASQVGIDVDLNITNASRHRITLGEADFVIKKGDRTLMNIHLREPVQLKSRYSGVVTIPLAVRFEGLLGALGVASTLSKGMDGCWIEGDVELRAGGIKKRVHLPASSLDGMSKEMLGFDPAQLLQ